MIAERVNGGVCQCSPQELGYTMGYGRRAQSGRGDLLSSSQQVGPKWLIPNRFWASVAAM